MSKGHAEVSYHDPMEPRAFRNSYVELTDWMRSQLLGEKNVDSMLAIARFYGEIQWRNFSGVYRDDQVEDAVESRVRQSKEFHLPRLSNGGGTVLITSDTYDSGGHSRVVLNWIKAFAEAQNHRLVITRSASSAFRQSLETQGAPYHLCANSGVDLIDEIVNYCANADRIVLHVHPDDIAASIASRILARSGKQVIFYNHADHVFSYGISSAQLVGEVSKYGIELNKRTQRTKAHSYIGIPIEFPNTKPHRTLPLAAGAKQTVLSCGAPYKYAPRESFFGDFIDSLLRTRHDVTFVLVGSTGNEPWWADTARRWNSRVLFPGEVSHGKYLELMRTADVYVDSFPITGGTAFPEALLNGQLVAGLNSPIQGYSPVDELRSEDVPALTARVIDLLDRNVPSICKLEEIRNQAEAVHSLKAFRERVESAYAGSCGKNFESNVAVDTFWPERIWETDCRYLACYDTPHWFRLPLSFSLSYLHKLHSVENLQKSTLMPLAIKQILLALLPPRIRQDLIVRRTKHLARAKRRSQAYE